MDPAALQVLHAVLDARRQGDPDPVSLPGADLRGAQLMRADLVAAELPGCGLDHAQLAGAKLVKADLRECMLRWADLGGADLTEADLRGADLSWARLEGASLAGCDLRGADVNGVVGQPSSLTGARFDSVMAQRSGLSDAAVVQLWRAGAEIEDIDNFPYVVKRACSADAAKLKSDAGPSARRVSEAEMKAVRLHVQSESAAPPSARATPAVMQQVLSSLPAPSLRTQKLVATDPAPAMKEAPAWKAGDDVMGVTLKTLIGEGNAGQVWRAENADGEIVAVKLFSHLRSGLGRSLASYRRGVSVMNRLVGLGPEKAKGVISIYGVSLNQLGFVMDYAENGSAVDLPALNWQVKQIVDFVEQVAAIMKRSHDAGALHRCLKPSNILLDEDLNPMVADFDMVDLPSLASTKNEAAGYAAYAAPEELIGQGTQSPTADIYSLGRILHFLLASERPSKLTEDVPTLEELEKQPAGLVRIIRKCCLRAPESRYQTVDELLADLENYDDHDEVGVAGGPEANFMPYRVSSLSHDTPWLDTEQRKKKSDPPPKRDKPRKRRGKRNPEAEADAEIGMDRNAEKGIGALGALILLASLLVVVLMSTPSSELVKKMHYASAVGGGFASFLLRRAENNAMIWRLVLMLLSAAALYWLDLPHLLR